MFSVYPAYEGQKVVRLLTRLPQCGVTTLTANVPGPRQPLQIMGQ
jgi:hypothetical protein